MHLIVITPENTIANEHGIVNGLFAAGLQRLHLRKPSFTIADHRKYLAGIDLQYHPFVVVHNNFELYDAYGLGGVHLNSAVRRDKTAFEKIKHLSQGSVSASFHSWQEILDNDFHYGYGFISPVFDSISKAGHKAGIDLKGAIDTKGQLARQNRYCPSIIGLGGVGEQQIEVLYKHGFDGAAFLGSIWMAEDPFRKFENILKVSRSL